MLSCAKSVCSSFVISFFLICSAYGGSLPGAPNCPMFPANNVWNVDISNTVTYPVDPNSGNYLANMATGTGLHPDFGSFAGYGIPYNVVSSAQAKVLVNFSAGAPTESDNGPYPIPSNPNIESNDLAACSSPAGNGDCHILIVDKDACILYELDAAATQGPGSWTAFSGAIWSLKSNALRTDTWTSGDAAGLPILPGLVRYDEVQAGLINHALRFTMVNTQKAHIYPARHDASSKLNTNLPPMGLRLRLKASTDISHFTPQAKVIAQAMKTYGIILADNGSNWYISGASDPNFDDNDLGALKTQLHGSDFEVVNTSGLRNGSDSSTATVNIAPGGALKYVDVTSNTSTTTIPVNTTVQWNWVDASHSHSTTSGNCCTPDGKWDSQVNGNGNVFINTFNQVGTYPYFCTIHNALMKGTVIVTPPSDYSLTISNSGILIFPGQTAPFSGKLTTSNGYNNTVNLSCGTGHPATCTPAPPSLTPTPGGAGFLVNASDVTPNDYTFNVQGIGTDTLQTSHAASVTLHVVDFNLTAPSPSTLTTAVSTNPTTTPTASFQVSISGSAFSGIVNLSCGGLPGGATCNFLPSASPFFSGPGSQAATVSITVAGNTAAGVYPLTVSANTAGAPAAKTQPLTLQVVDFTQGTPSPSPVAMTQNAVSQPVTFQLTPVAGFSAPVALSCAALANVSCSFSPNPAPVSGSPVTVTLTVTTNGAAVSSPTLTIQSAATVNGVALSHSQSLTLNISAGGTTTDLSISSLISQPDPVEAKGPIAINATAHNTGINAGSVNVSIYFSQPVKVINATLPGGCTVNTGIVTCAVGNLNAGNDAPYTIQIVPGPGRNLIITATVNSTSVNDSNPTNNVATVTAHIRPKPLARRGLVPRVP
ncbi:MAG TPA: plastocyanin/azurin family copper-binding protein [Terriglobales bacterium]|nr:plastocyanin/azurin family copper-binding protein [Terriglobales bacterium]